MEESRLRKFFHFSEADLLASRRGQFSEHQKKQLSQAAKAEQASARSSAVILFVTAAAGSAIRLVIGAIAPTLLGRILILSLMGILWPSVWVGKGVKIVRSAHALQQPRLCEVSGRVPLSGTGIRSMDYRLGVWNSTWMAISRAWSWMGMNTGSITWRQLERSFRWST